MTNLQHNLTIVVPYLGLRSTREALRFAARLSHGLDARIRLLCLECVSYAAPIDAPAVNVPFRLRQLQLLAEEAECNTPIRIDLRLCRDQWQQLARIALSKPLVLIGASSPAWWPSPENRMARWFLAKGCQVLRPHERMQSLSHA